MAIASVLDPTCRFHMVSICFPLIYSKEVVDENIKKVKYKILSKMTADILAIPISTVASESTFSAEGRVIG